jgi:uncharacterized protein YoxC
LFVSDPIFWLGLSLLLVAVSFSMVLLVLIPTAKELTRAARSVEKLADTLNRELPPTLEAIRLTGMEISDLTDDVSEGVQSAGQIVKGVDDSFGGARKQAKKVQTTTRGVFSGVKAAWRTFNRKASGSNRRPNKRLRSSYSQPLEFTDSANSSNSQEGEQNGDRRF